MNYTQEQLTQAFNKVQDKEHWKNPISAWIPIADLEVTAKAIQHFTGTQMTHGTTNGDLAFVFADGYRLGPCGDH